MDLRDIRKLKNLTQNEAAKLLGVNRRTYINYENGSININKPRYEYIFNVLNEYGKIDETHGVLKIEDIQRICSSIFKGSEVEFCYLFGSYAKGKASELSDVDLFIAMPTKGVEYYEIVERLREELKKKVDLIHETQLINNLALTKEIMKDGIKIYG